MVPYFIAYGMSSLYFAVETKLMITMLGARLVSHPKEFTSDNPRCFIIAEPHKKLKEQNYYDREFFDISPQS
jgi:hypothetical protein